MPEISVITGVCRSTYIQKQIEYLSKQTFKDFEWVVVDEQYMQNKGLKAGFPIIHIPPKNPKPYFAKASCLNDGLTLASGKLIYFMNDYVLPMKSCLQRHWEIQEKYKGIMLSGRAYKIDIKPEDIKENVRYKTTDYRMHLFDQGWFSWTPIEEGLFEVDRRGIENWMNGRNDSCPLEPLLDCNGFDESFDGRWGNEDADMAYRLMTYGLKFFMDKQSAVMEFPHQSGERAAIRTEAEQQALLLKITHKKVLDRIYTANEHRNLRREGNG